MFILLLICTILLACIVFPDFMGWLFGTAIWISLAAVVGVVLFLAVTAIS